MNGSFRTFCAILNQFVRQHWASMRWTLACGAVAGALGLFVLPAIVGSKYPNAAGPALAADSLCGDGVLNPGEQCDDGNTNDGDCCSATCEFEPAGSPCNNDAKCTADTCDGNGVCVSGPPVVCPPADPCYRDGVCDPSYGCGYSQEPDGTACDDGIACTLNDQCIGGMCMGTAPTCSDGIVESQGGCEQCDDGNTQHGDGCNASCRLEPSGRTCQRAIGRSGTWLLRGLRVVQRCRNGLNWGVPLYYDRFRTQPLTDPAECANEYGAARVIHMVNRVARRMTANGCTDDTARGLGACANTVDGLINPDESTGCLIEAHATATAALVAQEYPALTTTDPTLALCQRAIAIAGAGYVTHATMHISTCRNLLNRNIKLFFDEAETQRLMDPADCPSEFRTNLRNVGSGQTAYAIIAGQEPYPHNCTDALVASLGLCAATIDGLVSPDGIGGCLLAGHLAQVNALIQAEY